MDTIIPPMGNGSLQPADGPIEPEQKSSDQGPSIAYINEVVFKDLCRLGISLTDDCTITNARGLSAAQFLDAFANNGWSWPKAWHRRNRNYFAHDRDAAHLEKEVEEGKWIHVVVSPGLRHEDPVRGRGKARRHRMASDWSLPPRNVELHAEKGWLRPSSYSHLRQFLKDRLWRF